MKYMRNVWRSFKMVKFQYVEEKEVLTLIEPKIVKEMKLHPPKQSKTKIDQAEGLDYDKIANSSDFQRICVMIAKMINPEFFKSVSIRVSQPVMKEQLDNKISEYREVVNELKIVLAKRKAKIKDF